jgi:hypothetical protein
MPNPPLQRAGLRATRRLARWPAAERQVVSLRKTWENEHHFQPRE